MAITKIGTPELFDFSATNTALRLPTGTTAQRPTSPSAGQWRFNTTLKYVEYYDGAAWFRIDTEAPANPDDFPSQNFNVNTYTGNGGTQILDAKFNEAANFNGSSSYIEISQTLLGSGTLKTWSTSFWFKTSSATEQYLNNTAAAGANSGYSVYIKNSGYLIFTTSSGGGGTSEKGLEYQTDLSDGDWHNVVATYTSSGGTNDATLKLYVDGADVTSSSVAVNGYVAGSGSTYNSFTVPRIVLGRWADIGSAVAILEGAIDQVRFFNTTLTDDQAIDCYTDETTTTAATLNFPAGAGCIAAYQLDGDASDVGGTYGGVTTDIGYTGLKFQADFIWIKSRNASADHTLTDSVRGVQQLLSSNSNAAEGNQSPNGMTNFGANSFSVTDNSGGGSGVNGAAGGANSGTPPGYVAWCFKAGGAPTATNSAGAGNVPTAGSVKIDGADSTTALAGTLAADKISANTKNGFSIVKFTSSGSASNVGHGLSATPELIFAKGLVGFTSPWATYSSTTGATKRLDLNLTAGESSSGVWNNTAPTSTVFSQDFTSTSGRGIIAYCFHSVAGYQKIGSYTGSSNDINTISTEITSGDGGFEPAFLLIKNTAAASTNNWIMVDNKRSPANQRKQVLNANLGNAESTETVNINFLTNGFQLTNGNSAVNQNGDTYIYLAIAADKNTSVPTLANSFSPTIYTGNGGTQNIYTPFTPDFTWIKNRNDTNPHALFDSVRGAGRIISSNSTVASSGNNSSVNVPSKGDLLGSFNPNGFQVNRNYLTNSAYDTTNGLSSLTYVSWNWKAGGLPTINSDGDITSIVSANVAAGFSIVSFTCPSSNQNFSIGHGLGVKPGMVIMKKTNATGVWLTWHKDLSVESYYLQLNSTLGESGLTQDSRIWGDQSFTSTTISTSTGYSFDINDTVVSYCFADIAGYQKIGSYSGTGASGNIVSTGFEPSWLMTKRSDTGNGPWMIFDNKRNPSNPRNTRLGADLTAGDASFSVFNIDFNSTSFTLNGTDPDINGSGTYIYLAIA